MGDTSDRDSGEKVSALEGALREALEVIGPERVLRVIADAFPVTESDVIEIDTPRFHGKVQKVSVSMPEDLTAAIRERAGAGGFSRYVTEAAERRVRTESLGDLLAEMDKIYGPVSPELIEQARREWPDYEGD
ncbi:MAG TPA: hypothetical protein VGG75_26250 [Trebonia sp.]|jgi:hypothetical protein